MAAMKVRVYYDSEFGNTERIARAIADAFRGAHDAEARSIRETATFEPDAELVILGGPTQRHRMSPAVVSFLRALPPLDGTLVAAFDTRLARPRWLTGAAAGSIARALRRHGGHLVVPAESFLVDAREGPLLPGEIDRAACWGKSVLESGETRQHASLRSAG